jgi:hypothetical protein|tara:strand:- start:3713 stop:3961 length:249 start_codon:yes stop_codon:yes gene_type:complete
MNWTKESEPNNEVPYNHTKLETPIGEYVVDWKGWKERPSYDVSLKGECLGSEYDLESAKRIAENNLLELANQINGFLNQELI